MTTQPPNHPPTANFESIKWEEFVKKQRQQSRKIKQKFSYISAFHPVLFEITLLECPFCLFLTICKTFWAVILKKSKNEFKINNTRFLSFSVSFYLKKNCCEYSKKKMLRYLVRILHPQIFSLSSVAWHFFDNLNLNISIDRSEVEPTMNEKCVSNN